MFEKLLITAALLTVLVSPPIAAETTSGDAGPMAIDIGYGIIVNKDSTLRRKWVVVNDPNLAAQISNYNGTRTSYDTDNRRWVYEASYSIAVTEPIVAFEVRIIPFDIWGERDTPLSTTEIADQAVGDNARFDGKWRIPRESTALEHYVSVAYVAQVKLKSGKVLRADTNPIIEQVRNFAEDFSAGDLEIESAE